MLSDAKDYRSEQQIYDIVMLIHEIIQESVPQLVREELKKIQEDLIFNIKTYINGKYTDFPAVESEVRRLIENEIQKMKVCAIGDIHGTNKFLDCYMDIKKNDDDCEKIIVLGDHFDPYDNISLDEMAEKYSEFIDIDAFNVTRK